MLLKSFCTNIFPVWLYPTALIRLSYKTECNHITYSHLEPTLKNILKWHIFKWSKMPLATVGKSRTSEVCTVRTCVEWHSPGMSLFFTWQPGYWGYHTNSFSWQQVDYFFLWSTILSQLGLHKLHSVRVVPQSSNIIWVIHWKLFIVWSIVDMQGVSGAVSALVFSYLVLILTVF